MRDKELLDQESTWQIRSDGGRNPEYSDQELHLREEDPQGLLYFTRYDSVPIMVDGLFGSASSREFTQQELAEKANLSPRSVRERLDVLFELGIVTAVDDTDRFQLNLDNEITWKLRELDGLIKRARGTDSELSEQMPDFERSNDEDNGSGGIVNTHTDESLEIMEQVREQVPSHNYAD